MGTAYNFIDESERLFLEQGVFAASNIDDLWTSDGTIVTDPTVYLDSDFGSLKLTPSSSENYVRFNYNLFRFKSLIFRLKILSLRFKLNI
jgi:hypothetical protein